MSWSDAIGFVAAIFTLVTFIQTSMVAMRVAAILANLSFIAFGALAPCLPVLALHVILLPINVSRLWQCARTPKAPPVSTFRATGIN